MIDKSQTLIELWKTVTKKITAGFPRDGQPDPELDKQIALDVEILVKFALHNFVETDTVSYEIDDKTCAGQKMIVPVPVPIIFRQAYILAERFGFSLE